MSRNYSVIQTLRLPPFTWAAIAVVLVLVCATMAQAQMIDGFTQPFRSVDLSSDESGAIMELPVEEGSLVKTGDLVCKLDDRIQHLQLEMAEHQMNSKSELDAARRSFQKREVVLERLTELRSGGHASEAELIRSEMELSIAKSRYLAAQESAIGREIEFRRAQMLLERRMIRAPFNGTIAKIHRQDGEFISPLRPEIVTLVQTDTLLAVFNIPSNSNSTLVKGQKVKVHFFGGESVEGEVYSVGVVVESETVRVKIRIDNADGHLKSGMQCQLEI